MPSSYCDKIFKYPRTAHIEGSRLQPGDEDLSNVPFEELNGRHLVVEEKMDGANCAISFDGHHMRLQSRGHYLTGGKREKHFNLFKQWATSHQLAFKSVLGSSLIMYGEWLFAKHTVFYNRLPHYFMEFDVLDKQTGVFLDTPSRRRLLRGLPVVSVRVLHEGPLASFDALTGFIGPSCFIEGDPMTDLTALCRDQGLDPQRAADETDRSGFMEGLYVKHEEGGAVKGRYKWVRTDFLTAVFNAEGHWLNRPIIPNQLADGVDIFAMGAAS